MNKKERKIFQKALDSIIMNEPEQKGKAIKIKNRVMLFEDWERKHIIEFYKNPSYWGKSIVVCRYEMAKAKRDFCRDMIKMLRINKIANWINKLNK